MVVNPAPSAPPVATYEAAPKWQSPFTLAVLSWLGPFLGLASIFPIWKMVEPVVNIFAKGVGVTGQAFGRVWWIGGFCLLLLIFLTVMQLRRLAKNELRKAFISRMGIERFWATYYAGKDSYWEVSPVPRKNALLQQADALDRSH